MIHNFSFTWTATPPFLYNLVQARPLGMKTLQGLSLYQHLQWYFSSCLLHQGAVQSAMSAIWNSCSLLMGSICQWCSRKIQPITCKIWPYHTLQNQQTRGLIGAWKMSHKHSMYESYCIYNSHGMGINIQGTSTLLEQQR